MKYLAAAILLGIGIMTTLTGCYYYGDDYYHRPYYYNPDVSIGYSDRDFSFYGSTSPTYPYSYPYYQRYYYPYRVPPFRNYNYPYYWR